MRGKFIGGGERGIHFHTTVHLVIFSTVSQSQ